MQIRLERPLVVGSFTTIDGRGADVHIANGAGFLIEHAHDIIIHGLQFHKPRPNAARPSSRPRSKGRADRRRRCRCIPDSILLQDLAGPKPLQLPRRPP
ncbi:uncharacterized protein A4U43_C07F21500 [Asparagus officinalis]|uniref:Uncharacterized protein n=1 Tax=Asparagus officinalis TaxID=4686 RepID=A0A5P1EDW3_ASPOF|nr:uncharacterized protein A4U43_C07F21500 [Asparagus officinalis]